MTKTNSKAANGTAPNARHVRQALAARANPTKAAILQRFFKTGPGEYAEGDVFLGLTVPQQRQVARQFKALPSAQISRLLDSRIHEERLVGLLILLHQFERANETSRDRLCGLYLAWLDRVNNWDLVDLSAPRILGAWLLERDRALLYRLAKSRSLWNRRIALLASFQFIRHGQFADTLALVEQLLRDPEDLIHKAAGWMLREVGKRDEPTLIAFLDRHADAMPRTMLRYAIEKFPEPQRRHYLERKPSPSRGCVRQNAAEVPKRGCARQNAAEVQKPRPRQPPS